MINRVRNALANSRNVGTNSTSEGSVSVSGNQTDSKRSINSNISGDGSVIVNNGISYYLQGRGFRQLPKPKNDYQGEGKVVLKVSVNRSGKVLQTVPGVKGSTMLDDYLLKISKDAALQSGFEPKSEAPEVQKGTITYNFVLK
jgi:hypothetical protein